MTLDEIISKICLTANGHTPSGCGTGCELDEPELVKSAIIELFRSVVPENRGVPPRSDGSKVLWDTLLCDVWNDCRQQILENIERLK